MCTVLLAWRCVDGADYVLAANRDELVERPASGPVILHESPPIAGGRDLLAGGTWLAVSADSRACAVTNRRLPEVTEVVRDPSRRSRGEIPVAVLTTVDEAGMHAFFEGLGPGRYNPANVLYVSRHLAIVASVDDTGPPRVSVLEPGLHVLTVGDIDDPRRAKDGALATRLGEAWRASRDARELERSLRTVLASHESPTGDPLDAPCIHGEVYGTVSSSSLIGSAGPPEYRHAPGRPDAASFELVTLLDQC